MPSRVLECDFSLHLGSGIETIGACSVKTFRYSKHWGLISSEFSTMNVSLYALSEFSDQGLAEAGDQRPASIEPRGRRIGSGAGNRNSACANSQKVMSTRKVIRLLARAISFNFSVKSLPSALSMTVFRKRLSVQSLLSTCTHVHSTSVCTHTCIQTETGRCGGRPGPARAEPNAGGGEKHRAERQSYTPDG